jgi:phosphatidylserine/phosphatidylglycerophosphate/cardiolipin synthase-like enzyme
VKKLFLILIVAFLLPACTYSPADDTPRPLPPVEVFFSPNGGCTDAIAKEIHDAKSSILVQAYSFTSSPIAKALVSAKRPGMRIEVILDKSQRTEKYSSADFLHNMGIPVRIDARHAIAHNKIIIIDGETVTTGSFNFTKSAEQSNAENLLIIRDKALADKYTANWNKHAEHSEVYEGRQEKAEKVEQGKPKEPEEPTTGAGLENYDGFVASKNSEVFHKPDCKGAKKIASKNLLRYSSREQAVQDGKKPCAECKP